MGIKEEVYIHASLLMSLKRCAGDSCGEDLETFIQVAASKEGVHKMKNSGKEDLGLVPEETLRPEKH